VANALFDSARSQFLQGTLVMTDSIKVIGVDHADDNPDVSTDDFYDDIVGAAIVMTSGALANKTYTAGVFDADDITISTVSGDPFESLVFFNDTPGTAGTKDLIAKVDTATGLPCTPNGADITLQFDSGANKIFKL
jgi:hypothetical protein